jgi:hypothetical protein
VTNALLGLFALVMLLLMVNCIVVNEREAETRAKLEVCGKLYAPKKSSMKMTSNDLE